MKLFNKTKIRFETITIERRNEVFRALENRGWTLITDPYQIDMDKTPEKLRKISMKNAKELHGELVVETWDPIHLRQPFKGLTYSVWRQMTPAEIQQKKVEREKERSGRPDYSDTMGSLEDLSRKMLEKPKVEIHSEDMQAIDDMARETRMGEIGGKAYGEMDAEMVMVRADFDTVSVENPYDNFGKTGRDLVKGSSSSAPGTLAGDGSLPGVRSTDGPVFDNSMKLDIGGYVEEKVKEVDPLAMMMAAADEAPPSPPPQPEVPQPAAPPVTAPTQEPKAPAVPPVQGQQDEGQ